MLEVTLAGGREAPTRARMAVQGLNGALSACRQSVHLLVSELVTNAVRHGGTGDHSAVTVKLNSTPEYVRVEVFDGGPGFAPRLERRPDPLSGGFGLLLLDELADRWGVDTERGTCVWFEIERGGRG